MKRLAILMLGAALLPVAASAALPANSTAAAERTGPDLSLCVVGRASDQHKAIVATPQARPSKQQMDAIADALLNCSPKDMKANRAQTAPVDGKIALLSIVRLTQSIPAGNG